MADKKISALSTATTPLAGTEVLPLVQSNATVKVSVADLTAGRAVSMAGGTFTDTLTQGVAAKGLNFSANTAQAGKTSQLLNWYEEGTYAPSMSPSTSGTITASGAARYTRVGRLVIVEGYINVSAVSSPTGDLRLGNFPFLINGAHPGSGSLQVYGFANTVATNGMYILAVPATTYVIIRGFLNGAQVVDLAPNAQNGAGMQFTIAYTV